MSNNAKPATSNNPFDIFVIGARKVRHAPNHAQLARFLQTLGALERAERGCLISRPVQAGRQGVLPI